MALADLIAQKIARAAQERMGLTNLSSGIATLGEGVAAGARAYAAGKQANAEREAKTADRKAQAADKKAANAGLSPEDAAMVSENALRAPTLQPTPATPEVPDAFGMGAAAAAFSTPALRQNVSLQTEYAEKKKNLERALTAEGGAKVLAKVAYYTAEWNRRQEESSLGLKAAAELEAKVQQVADEEAGNVKANQDFINAAKAQGVDTTGWTPEMDAARLGQLFTQAKVGSRFGARQAFSREKWEESVAQGKSRLALQAQGADLAKTREGRIALMDSYSAAKSQVDAFEKEMGLRLKLDTMDETTAGLSFRTVYKTDPSVLSPEQKTIYEELKSIRDNLANRAIGLSGDGITSEQTYTRPEDDPEVQRLTTLGDKKALADYLQQKGYAK